MQTEDFAVQWFPASPGELMGWAPAHATVFPRAFPMGEHIQDNSSHNLFSASDFQLFAGTKKFMATSPVNALTTPLREGCCSNGAGLDQQGSVQATGSFIHSFCVSPLQLSATWQLTHTGTRTWSGFCWHTHQQPPLHRRSLPLHTNRAISTVDNILPHRKQIKLAWGCRVLNLYPMVLNNYHLPNLLWVWVSIHITQLSNYQRQASTGNQVKSFDHAVIWFPCPDPRPQPTALPTQASSRERLLWSDRELGHEAHLCGRK